MHPRLQSPDYRQLAEKSSNAACLHEGRGAVQCSVPQVPGVDDVEVDGFGQGGGYGLQAHANYAGQRKRKQAAAASGAGVDLVLFAAATRQRHGVVQLHDEQQHV